MSIADNVNVQVYTLPDHFIKLVSDSLKDWELNNKSSKLWAKDDSLWTNTDESKWLGWLDVVAGRLEVAWRLKEIVNEFKNSEFSHVLLLGMGGSSLCPEVLNKTFGKTEGSPILYVLDSTNPEQLEEFKKKIDLAKTLFIVASKSGTTLEPNILEEYFFDCVEKIKGSEAGKSFIAITDPGSKLEQIARSKNFRYVFHGVPSIGGRYSALSNFGVIPASIMGLDVVKLLTTTSKMVDACGANVDVTQNPGVILGNILGVLANQGCDKVTFVASPDIASLVAWLEQLIAESTGKHGKGIIPIAGEEISCDSTKYSKDRIFVYLRSSSNPSVDQDQAIEILEKAGHPIVRIEVTSNYHIGQEFFRWEIATAVAGSILGINPFDQPDVEDSKIATKTVMSKYEEIGHLPHETPIYEDKLIELFASDQWAGFLEKQLNQDKSFDGYLRAHFSQLGEGSYFALLAYLSMNDVNDTLLQSIRNLVLHKKKIPTCLSYGPRFLHSIGQLYKGGPNKGIFLQITANSNFDIQIPNKKYTFGVVNTAQALGDLQVLIQKNRKVLRIHIKEEQQGLEHIRRTIDSVLV